MPASLSDRWRVFYAFPSWFAHSPDLSLVRVFGTLADAHTWATEQAEQDAQIYAAPEAWGGEACS